MVRQVGFVSLYAAPSFDALHIHAGARDDMLAAISYAVAERLCAFHECANAQGA